MEWRLAGALVQLRREVDAAAPGRSKASDGTIGDDSHAARASDHNPNAADVVCAFDATHDPGSGADMRAISEHIRTHRPPALKYLIFNKRIASADSGWAWVAYNGRNPHTRHMHVSVGRGYDGSSTGPYDDTTSWGISSATTGGDDDMSIIGLKEGDRGDRVEALQVMLRDAGFDPGSIDSVYGKKVSAAVLKCRKASGSSADFGDKITGHAYMQLLEAWVQKKGTGERGPRGLKGDKGDPGTFPKTVRIEGTATEVSA